MRRQTGAILVFIGVILIVFSVVGLSGFTLSLTGDIMQEDWNQLGWQTGGTGTEVCTGGYLTLTPDPTTTDYSSGRASVLRATTLTNQFSVEWKMKINEWGSGGRTVGGKYMSNDVLLKFETGAKSHQVYIFNTHIDWPTAPGQFLVVSYTTDTFWHTWTLTVDEMTNTAKLYIDENLQATWNTLFTVTCSNSVTLLMSRYGEGDPQVMFDYIYVDQGIHPPNGEPPPPPPDTGTVRVYTYIDGSQVSSSSIGVTVSLNGPDVNTQIATPYTSSGMTLGSYTAFATYQGTTATDTASLTAGGTITLQLNWGTTPPPPPPPPNGDDWITKLIAIFDNPAVRAVELILGIGCAGCGMIGIIFYTKPSPPP